MTLIVSDISRYGIIMVGDSAVTRRMGGVKTVSDDAFKVQYADAANIGFAVWGNAGVPGRRMDYWINDFINDSVKGGASVEETGQKLATSLNEILEKSGREWKDLVRGVHLTGYRDGLPVLFHVHCGHEGEPSHELRLYHDYPDDQKWNEREFRSLLQDGFIHLRNGYHKLFGPLFQQALGYAEHLRREFKMEFPHHSLRGRFDFYKVLVKFIAGTLIASQEHPGVNEKLSAIAFDQSGLIINEQLVIPAGPVKAGAFDEFL